MANNITNSHDKLFKETWSNKVNAKSFLENYLPEKILNITDLDSLELCKDSFISKNLKEFYSDMLYKVNFEKESGFKLAPPTRAPSIFSLDINSLTFSGLTLPPY